MTSSFEDPKAFRQEIERLLVCFNRDILVFFPSGIHNEISQGASDEGGISGSFQNMNSVRKTRSQCAWRCPPQLPLVSPAEEHRGNVATGSEYQETERVTRNGSCPQNPTKSLDHPKKLMCGSPFMYYLKGEEKERKEMN